MRKPEHPYTQSFSNDGAMDNIDQLLRTFFQSEMPKPWPGPPAVESRLRIGPRARFGAASRYVLAASIALLFCMSLVMANSFRISGGQHADPGLGIGTRPVFIPGSLPPAPAGISPSPSTPIRP